MATTPIKISGIRAANPASTPLTGDEVWHASQGSPPDSVGLSVGEVIDYGQSIPLSLQNKTANYTLVLADGVNRLITMEVASANTLTVPPNASVAFDVGTVVPLISIGAGQTTVVEGAGVTVNTPETLKLRMQYSAAVLIKVDTDEWVITGDLELAP